MLLTGQETRKVQVGGRCLLAMTQSALLRLLLAMLVQITYPAGHSTSEQLMAVVYVAASKNCAGVSSLFRDCHE